MIFMREEILTLWGTQVYLAMPDGASRKWTMGIHGSGRDALCYRDVPFYAAQCDLALASGCAFAAVSLGQAVWGREDGFALLLQLYRWMVARGYDKRFVPMASSAGGCQMYWYAQHHPCQIAALVGIFPVWDMRRVHLRSMEAAWGAVGEALQSLIAPRNPAVQPEPLPAVPIVICHGIADAAVPVHAHTLRLAARYPTDLHLTGDGHCTRAFSLYETPMIAHVLTQYVQQGVVS